MVSEDHVSIAERKTNYRLYSCYKLKHLPISFFFWKKAFVKRKGYYLQLIFNIGPLQYQTHYRLQLISVVTHDLTEEILYLKLRRK